MQGKLKTIFVLHLLLILYVGSDVCSKYAACFEFGSLEFLALWAGAIVILALYALGWQQIIKRIDLTTAYANRALTIVWGIILGVVFFGEAITFGKVIGAAVVIAGVVLYVMGDAELEKGEGHDN